MNRLDQLAVDHETRQARAVADALDRIFGLRTCTDCAEGYHEIYGNLECDCSCHQPATYRPSGASNFETEYLYALAAARLVWYDDGGVTYPHASDCGCWVSEPCDCVTGRF